MSVVAATARDVIGDRKVVHSTSWRRDRAAVMLGFVAVIDATQVGAMATVEGVGRSWLVATQRPPPAAFATAQVVEHGPRHLAWLVKDAPVVAEPGVGG